MPARHGLTLYTDYQTMIEILSKPNKYSPTLRSYDIYKHRTINSLYAAERTFGVFKKNQRFVKALLPQLGFDYLESFSQPEPPKPGSHLKVVK